ncbi:MAG TPA: RodZ domain-containing protein [Thermoanaerobaculia bacterium]|nr:RodZ domain-containing protein [Thermoanaerobaculia bacterium]
MTETKSKPWEGGGEGGSFGAWLRRQREVREISLREIAETSKISLRYLEALEQDRFDLLPAPLFAKGFLREYAKFVGLDPDEVVNYYLSALPAEDGTDRQSLHQSPRQRPPWTVVTLVLAAVVVLSAALWYFSRRSEPEGAPPTIVAPPRTEPAVGATEEQRSTKPVVVTLDFTQNSWVDAFVDGTRTVSELRVQGESLRLEADREVRFRLSNPAGVNVELNGRAFEAAPASAEEYVSVDLDDLAAEPRDEPDPQS